MTYRLRVAVPADEALLSALIARSIRALGLDSYTPAQIEAALLGAFGVDGTLLQDGSYFAATTASGEIVGCGGWSRRRTLFGGDRHAGRDPGWLDPKREAARIRAFFIDPGHARRGLGRMILEHSETAAALAGFSRCELMATLPGVRLYARCGYAAGPPVEHELPGGLAITFVPMSKDITPARGSSP